MICSFFFLSLTSSSGIFKRIATSFTAVVNSFISDMVLPLVSMALSLIPFMSSTESFEEKFLILKQGHHAISYNTRAQAIADGAVILAYGYVLIVYVTQILFYLFYKTLKGIRR